MRSLGQSTLPLFIIILLDRRANTTLLGMSTRDSLEYSPTRPLICLSHTRSKSLTQITSFTASPHIPAPTALRSSKPTEYSLPVRLREKATSSSSAASARASSNDHFSFSNSPRHATRTVMATCTPLRLSRASISSDSGMISVFFAPVYSDD